ncbi:hypothetical protein ACS0TY_015076 [Phlomoides rotata]
MWLDSDKCKRTVEIGWNNTNSLLTFKERTKRCGAILTNWEEKQFGNVGKRLREARELLDKLQQK